MQFMKVTMQLIVINISSLHEWCRSIQNATQAQCQLKMSSVLIKAICAIVASILAIALVVVFTILVYQEFAQSPKEYENERRMEKYDDDGGCAFRYLVGNGICDDESNIKSCDFDGDFLWWYSSGTL